MWKACAVPEEIDMAVRKRVKNLGPTVATLLILAILLITVLPLHVIQADPACVITDSGDLAKEIRTISDQMPSAGSNGMVVPTPTQMAAWETVIEASVSGDLVTACNAIETNGFPYQIVRYTDTGDSDKRYLMLKENVPVSVGWGTYVFKTDSLFRDLIIEVPHPRYDLNTDDQGIDIFRQINARAFLMAGTHRCANSASSPCDGTTTVCSGGTSEPYRESDVSHATQTMFQVSHRKLVECGSSTVAVQLHGNGRSSCPDLFVSNTTCTPGQRASRLYANATTECGGGGFSIDFADCIEPECSLKGSTNVQGRYSNGCSIPGHDPCSTPVSSPTEPERFIHLEQSSALRQDYDCLIAALKVTFLYNAYLPLVLRN
jgi:hypothetical protein